MVQRLAYWDNIKMLLIFLVVLGHAIAYGWWTNEPHLLGVYNCIYAFHMPLFVLISGYLSRNITCQREKDIVTLLFPYLMFQVFNVLYIRYVENGKASWNLFIPYHQNWYILALLIWRLITPYFKNVKYSIVICIAVLLSVVFSKYNVQNNLFALPHVFVFLPFYVIGYYAENIFNKLEDSTLNLILSICAIVGCSAIIYYISAYTAFGVRLSYAFKPPYNCGTYIDYIFRYVGFLFSLIMSLSVLIIMRRWVRCANSYKLFGGGGTVLIYLMHNFIVIPLWDILPKYHWTISLLISGVISILICWVFSRPRVIKMFAPLLDFSALREMCSKMTKWQSKNN